MSIAKTRGHGFDSLNDITMNRVGKVQMINAFYLLWVGEDFNQYKVFM